MTSKSSEKLLQNHAPKGRGSRLTRNNLGKSKGFTLMELLVVIAIIGLLSSIILASLSNARKRGRDGRRIAYVKQIQLALEMYFDANQKYPTSLSLLTTPGYIPAIPHDPSSGLDYAYVALEGASIDPLICGSYHLGVKMEINSVGNGGSAFNDDADTTAGGVYGTGSGDGPLCTNSSWAGNADIAPIVFGAGNDFDGTGDGTGNPPKLIYDMRP